MSCRRCQYKNCNRKKYHTPAFPSADIRMETFLSHFLQPSLAVLQGISGLLHEPRPTLDHHSECRKGPFDMIPPSVSVCELESVQIHMELVF